MGHQQPFPAQLMGTLAAISSPSSRRAWEKQFYGMEPNTMQGSPLGRALAQAQMLEKSAILAREFARMERMAQVGALAKPSDEEILAELVLQDRAVSPRGMTAIGDVLSANLRAVAWRSIQYWRRRAIDRSLPLAERHKDATESVAILATCRRHGLLEVT